MSLTKVSPFLVDIAELSESLKSLNSTGTIREYIDDQDAAEATARQLADNALQTAINGKASATHTHVATDITNLASLLAAKSDTTHTHSGLSVGSASLAGASSGGLDTWTVSGDIITDGGLRLSTSAPGFTVAKMYVNAAADEVGTLVSSLANTFETLYVNAAVTNRISTDAAVARIQSATPFTQTHTLLTMRCGTNQVFEFKSNGSAYADGAFVGGGADRAEMFEWLDGNPSNEDRVGVSVTLEAGKIRRAESHEEPIGVVSATYDSLGNAAEFEWSDRWVRDELGRYVTRDVTVYEFELNGEKHTEYADEPSGVTIPAHAVTRTERRRVSNPKHDPSVPYTPRTQRKEWAAIGVLGIVRVRSGEAVGRSWVLIRNVSATVQEYLVK